MAMDEDLSEFLDSGDFAVDAIFDGNTVQVIHEREFLEQLGVQTSAPTALGRRADFEDVAQEDTITIGSTDWKVKEFHHDPPGFPDFTLLLLGTS